MKHIRRCVVQTMMDLRTEVQRQFEQVIQAMTGHVSEQAHKNYYQPMRLGIDYKLSLEGYPDELTILVSRDLLSWHAIKNSASDIVRVYKSEFSRRVRVRYEARTEVVNVRHFGQKDYVYIGRANRSWSLEASEWANPFKLSQHKDKTRAEVIEMYRDWIVKQSIYVHISELQGRRLACWCHPQSCHGDVLAELADATLQPRAATTDGAD